MAGRVEGTRGRYCPRGPEGSSDNATATSTTAGPGAPRRGSSPVLNVFHAPARYAGGRGLSGWSPKSAVAPPRLSSCGWKASRLWSAAFCTEAACV